jgi:predicted DNA-binding protein (MmcQ/YjbR family)
MEINLDELMTLQSALVNIKMFLSEERKMDSDNLAALVDEAYELVMKKIDSLQQPFYL